MTAIEEIYAWIETRSIRSKEQTALRYAVGMLNEIRLEGAKRGAIGQTVGASIAEVALEGIKKRLTGEEK